MCPRLLVRLWEESRWTQVLLTGARLVAQRRHGVGILDFRLGVAPYS
jgi:hypothetical protein